MSQETCYHNEGQEKNGSQELQEWWGAPGKFFLGRACYRARQVRGEKFFAWWGRVTVITK